MLKNMHTYPVIYTHNEITFNNYNNFIYILHIHIYSFSVTYAQQTLYKSSV